MAQTRRSLAIVFLFVVTLADVWGSSRAEVDHQLLEELDFQDLSLDHGDLPLEDKQHTQHTQQLWDVWEEEHTQDLWDTDASEAGTGVWTQMLTTASHRALHHAAVVHAAHKRSQQLSDGKPITLPTIPKSPPVCSPPPAMRFCKNVLYPVYRPSAAHTFAQLDFDSHAVFKKIVPHMRISEKHFELPVIQQCRNNFRSFLCLRNFPKCCHVGLCNRYGDPEPALTAASLIPAEAVKRQKATTVTFVNGSRESMRVDEGRNDTVKVKVANAVCLQYVKTYTPLFDCRSQCRELLSKDCLYMLSQDCDNLCYGVHSERCATKQLFQIAMGKDSSASPSRPSAVITLLIAVTVALLGLVSRQ